MLERPHRSIHATASGLTLVLLGAPATAQLFGPPVTFPAPNARGLVVADLNGDGNLDIAASDQTGSAVSVLLGDGFGGYGQPKRFATGTTPQFLATADLNGDLKPDLVTANFDANNVSVLLGKGTGTFLAAQNFATGPYPVCVAVGDVNGDGRSDLVSSNFGLNATISVLLANTSGGYAAAFHQPVGSAADHVALSDFNADGKLDVVVTNRYSHTITVRLGIGRGRFGPAMVTPVKGKSPAGLAVADLNADGKQDLAITTYQYNGAVNVLLGNGAGGFVQSELVLVGHNASAVAVSDLDADGKADVIVGDGVLGANHVYVLLGDGAGRLKAPITFALDSTPQYIAVGDCNRDGRPDLVATEFWSSRVALLFSSGAPRTAGVGATECRGEGRSWWSAPLRGLSAAWDRMLDLRFAAEGPAHGCAQDSVR